MAFDLLENEIGRSVQSDENGKRAILAKTYPDSSESFVCLNRRLVFRKQFSPDFKRPTTGLLSLSFCVCVCVCVYTQHTTDLITQC